MLYIVHVDACQDPAVTTMHHQYLCSIVNCAIVDDDFVDSPILAKVFVLF